MKNMLNLRQSVTQTLAMTPQLQQAIRLLQLSQQELEIEFEILSGFEELEPT